MKHGGEIQLRMRDKELGRWCMPVSDVEDAGDKSNLEVV
jgi:hypothetical protein